MTKTLNWNNVSAAIINGKEVDSISINGLKVYTACPDDKDAIAAYLAQFPIVSMGVITPLTNQVTWTDKNGNERTDTLTRMPPVDFSKVTNVASVSTVFPKNDPTLIFSIIPNDVLYFPNANAATDCTLFRGIKFPENMRIGNMRFDVSRTLKGAFSTSNIAHVGNIIAPYCQTLVQAFNQCISLKSVGDLSQMSPKGVDLQNTFYGCNALEEVGALPKATKWWYTLHGCIKLRKVGGICDISSVKKADIDGLIRVSLVYTECPLNTITFSGIGTLKDNDYYDFAPRCETEWGWYEGESRQSLIDTFITYSFDRAANGYSPCGLKMRLSTYGQFTEEELEAITNKGYYIVVWEP